MNQIAIGSFISKKRKEKNLTQEQLAEKLGISNKTISKWETGRCMPDYAVIRPLCAELDITVSELMNGEESEEKLSQSGVENQIMDLLKRTEELEKQKNQMISIIFIVCSMALGALSSSFGGSVAGGIMVLITRIFAVGMSVIGVVSAFKNTRKR